MKILIGICGLGLGHSLREKVIIDFLLQQKAEICLVTEKQSAKFYEEFYPNIKLLKAEIPFISCGISGINYDYTIERGMGKEYFLTEIGIYKQIEEEFGTPDLVLSDYELYSARYAYIHGIRLINLEQQSKYLGFNTKPLDGFSREEEASRLRLFFPRSNARFATSFFEIAEESTDFPVTLVGPVICEDVLKQANNVRHDSKEVLVYVSPFATDEKYWKMISEIISANSNRTFNVFTNFSDIKNYLNFGNVCFYSYSRDKYLEKLLCSEFVISNAGHQFISEVILLEKPMLLYPFSTYDQHYCAYVAEQNHFGVNIKNKSYSQIQASIENIDNMRQSIVDYKKRVDYVNKINNVIDYIKGELNEK